MPCCSKERSRQAPRLIFEQCAPQAIRRLAIAVMKLLDGVIEQHSENERVSQSWKLSCAEAVGRVWGLLEPIQSSVLQSYERSACCESVPALDAPFLYNIY